MGQPAGKDGEYVPTTKPPEFRPLELDVEWKVLPQDLLYAILRIPDDQAQIENTLWGMDEYDDDYPDHTEFFWVRQSACPLQPLPVNFATGGGTWTESNVSLDQILSRYGPAIKAGAWEHVVPFQVFPPEIRRVDTRQMP